jgi:uncharacterized membrane protein YccC
LFCLLSKLLFPEPLPQKLNRFADAMDDELREIRAQLAEERQRREEEQIRREEADVRARIEQNKREHAERAAASAISQDLATFLDGCHRLSKLIKPVTKASSTTGGSTTS